MPTVTATELHDRTAELTTQAMKNPEDPIVVKTRGKAAVVLVDARYFEGLLETLDILSDPDAMEGIRRGLADIEAGRLIDHEEVGRRLGLNVTQRHDSVDRKRVPRAKQRRKSNRAAKTVRQAK